MLLSSLLLIPLFGVFIISTIESNELSSLYKKQYYETSLFDLYLGIDETLLLAVFLVLDILLFYIFFESLFGSSNRVRASSLFLLLSILSMYSIMGTTNFDALYKTNFNDFTQIFLFSAHVESPLSGSIILAGIVLKLSLYACNYTYIVYLIGVITIIYASFSTLRTIDIKELIAYSSVSHAAVYLLAVFSNTIQGIEGGILLGLAHGGVLYDRSSTRLITYYKGIAQLMPLFSILFFILSLANCGVPLTLNFLGEFMSLYGIFERLPLLAYTIFMFNRIAFAGSYSKYFLVNIPDLNKREFFILLILVVFTVLLGVYPIPILEGLHFSVSSLIYNF
ncbi:hypothetical protein EV356DRAFT_522098 [Viridothelium virens]|uniref:NADH:quinone oxidoreductase/Mrp antiporter transmembrane domain-containing protein n=1 Tax=Viridothelium virens TaxID=1048519 RepID=A0A6A6GSG3_VIRVR|nr:hypothetical protein EV356DRAFT_522098 [Viridothelium virens]